MAKQSKNVPEQPRILSYQEVDKVSELSQDMLARLRVTWTEIRELRARSAARIVDCLHEMAVYGTGLSLRALSREIDEQVSYISELNTSLDRMVAKGAIAHTVENVDVTKCVWFYPVAVIAVEKEVKKGRKTVTVKTNEYQLADGNDEFTGELPERFTDTDAVIIKSKAYPSGHAIDVLTPIVKRYQEHVKNGEIEQSQAALGLIVKLFKAQLVHAGARPTINMLKTVTGHVPKSRATGGSQNQTEKPESSDTGENTESGGMENNVETDSDDTSTDAPVVVVTGNTGVVNQQRVIATLDGLSDSIQKAQLPLSIEFLTGVINHGNRLLEVATAQRDRLQAIKDETDKKAKESETETTDSKESAN